MVVDSSKLEESELVDFGFLKRLDYWFFNAEMMSAIDDSLGWHRALSNLTKCLRNYFKGDEYQSCNKYRISALPLLNKSNMIQMRTQKTVQWIVTAATEFAVQRKMKICLIVHMTVQQY